METVSSSEFDAWDEPFNDLDTKNIATVVFPTLFPDGVDGPTNNATVCDILQSVTDSYAQKLKHLVRFVEVINGKWCYSFAAHFGSLFWLLGL